jgi:RHS repeat-associated protein
VNVPDENPSGLGAFEFPGRFPGQYLDRETNLAYNMARDYDSGLGQYTRSDPIGLKGGLNTYAYARSAPIRFVDPSGEDPICGPGRNKVGTNPDGSVQCTDNGQGPNEKVCATGGVRSQLLWSGIP